MEKDTAKSVALTNHNGPQPTEAVKIPVPKQQQYTKTVVTESTGFAAPPRPQSPTKSSKKPKEVSTEKVARGVLTKQTATKATGTKAPPRSAKTKPATAKPATAKKGSANTRGATTAKAKAKRHDDDSSDTENSDEDAASSLGDDDDGNDEGSSVFEEMGLLKPGAPLLKDNFGVSEVYSKLLLFQRCFDVGQLLPEIVSRIAFFLYFHTDEYLLSSVYGGSLAHWTKATGLKHPSNIVSFLRKLSCTKHKFPPLALRERGLLRDIWADLPDWLSERRDGTDQKTSLEFYGGDIAEALERAIRAKYAQWKSAKLARKEKEALPAEHAVSVEIGAVVAHCSRYYYACASEDGPGSPYRMVGTPEAVAIFAECWRWAQTQHPDDVEEAIEYLSDLPMPDCVGSCGLLDTASRECLLY